MQQDKPDIVFIDGMYVKKPDVDWKVACIDLNIPQLMKFLAMQNDERIKIDIHENKDGNGYHARLNQWKPDPKAMKQGMKDAREALEKPTKKPEAFKPADFEDPIPF